MCLSQGDNTVHAFVRVLGWVTRACVCMSSITGQMLDCGGCWWGIGGVTVGGGVVGQNAAAPQMK